MYAKCCFKKDNNYILNICAHCTPLINVINKGFVAVSSGRCHFSIHL